MTVRHHRHKQTGWRRNPRVLRGVCAQLSPHNVMLARLSGRCYRAHRLRDYRPSAIKSPGKRKRLPGSVPIVLVGADGLEPPTFAL